MLHNSFSVKLWIRPKPFDGILFSINRNVNVDNGDEDYFLYGLVGGTQARVRFNRGTELLADLMTPQAITIDNWQLIGVTAEWNGVSTTVNHWHNADLIISSSFEELFHDSLSYIHLLGAEQNFIVSSGIIYANFYNGFIYRLCISNRPEVDFPDDIDTPTCPDTDFCTSCPSDPICLIDCDFNQHLSHETHGTCVDCDSTCTTGCVRDRNCNPCIDNLCAVCPTWDVCEQCLDNATLDPPCECDEEFYEVNDACDPCDARCAECIGPNNTDCFVCNDGFFKQDIYDTCIDRCPTGCTTNGPPKNSCTCDDNTPVFCVTFPNLFLENWFDSVNSIRVVAGYEDTIEGSEPSPISDRGVYFDAVDDHLQIENIMLHMQFSLQTWVRPDTLNGTLFSINKLNQAVAGQEDFITWSIVNGLSDILFKTNNHRSSAAAVTQYDWGLVTVSVLEEGDGSQTVTHFANVGSISTDTQSGGYLIDSYTYNHYIGAEYTNPALTNFYNGLMYEFKIYIVALEVIENLVANPDCGEDFCTNCPASTGCTNDEVAKCLIDCGFNQFHDGTSCGACPAECPEGCLRAENCRLCADEECVACDGFYEECKECIANATLVDGDCACDPGYEYDRDLHECVSICGENCESCSDNENPDYCDKCKEGTYMIPGSQVCLTTCPTGYTPSLENPVC